MDGLQQDCSNSIDDALELPQSCCKPSLCTGIILGMGWAIERRRYTVTPPLIGWAHTLDDPWCTCAMIRQHSLYDSMNVFKECRANSGYRNIGTVVPSYFEIFCGIVNPESKGYLYFHDQLC